MERKLIFNILAALCAIWFVLLSWAWVYLFNVLFVFPVGIVGIVLWLKGRDSEYKTLHRVTAVLFVAGLLSALTSIFLFR